MAWTIAAHAGVLDLQTAVEAAPYPYAVNAVGGLPTGAVTAAHATLARVDIVWLRIDDPAEADGSSVPAVVAGYTAGTAASSPAAPATPARCMVLGWVNVPASGGGSPTVTWVAPYAVAAGVLDPAVVNKTTAAVGPTSGTTRQAVVLAPNVTGDGVKKFKITASVPMVQGTVVTDHFYMVLLDATTGVDFASYLIPFTTTAAGIFSPGGTYTIYDTPAAGLHGYRLDIMRAFGTGTGLVYLPTEVIVEQIA